MFREYPPGSNITFMNSLYNRYKDPKNDRTKENLSIIIKDLDTGLKKLYEIDHPDYEFYVAKPDKRVAYNRFFIPAEDAALCICPFNRLEKNIAKAVGATEFYFQNASNGNYQANRKLHLHPDVFNSDMNIQDHYRFRFDKEYKNEICPITKSYLDIEADTIHMAGDFPELGECPINAVTLVIQERMQVYTFLLRTKGNDQIAAFEESVKNRKIFPELTSFVVDAVGGKERAHKFEIDKLNFGFLFYDEEDEIQLIADIFRAVNEYKPDFLLAWNMAFDIPYIIHRIRRLGYDPEEIICHPDFEFKACDYFIDYKNKDMFGNRGDYANISSYTTFLDQMINFASIRKGQGTFTSYSLDFIGEEIAKVRKLDYKHITTNIAELPYKDYKTFVFYNIMDVIVQYCIEYLTRDIEFVFSKSLINNTRYDKCHRQTIYLVNRGIKEFYNLGYIMGNNCNKFNEKPDTKFPGAFVADPRMLDDYSKMRINGVPVMIFNNLDDFDYSSLYPSIYRQFNMAPNTQIGMIIIDQKVHDKEDKRNDEQWSRAGAFLEDMQSQVWMEIAHRWLHLADYTELYNEVIEFFTTMANPTFGLKMYNKNGLIVPLQFDNPDIKITDPLIFLDEKYEEKFIAFDENKFREWREHAIKEPNQHF